MSIDFFADTTILALIGSVIAIAQAVIAFFSYRRNQINTIGFEPIVIFTNVMRWPHAEFPRTQQGDELSVSFEIWNRRTYPISLQSIDVAVEGDEGFEAHRCDAGGLHAGLPLDDGFAGPSKPILFKPSDHYPVECTFHKGKPGVAEPPVVVTLQWIDPLSGKSETMRQRHQHAAPQKLRLLATTGRQ